MKDVLRSAARPGPSTGADSGKRRPRRSARWLAAVSVTVTLAVLGVAPAQAAPPPMSSYMECARSMSVAVSEQFAVLPGERFGGRGVYVYTDRGAYFVPFGAPVAQDALIREFLLRTH